MRTSLRIASVGLGPTARSSYRILLLQRTSPLLPRSSLTSRRLKEKGAAGLILSGGGGVRCLRLSASFADPSQSVYAEDLHADRGLLDMGIPVLGICYGFQWLAHVAGGEVNPGKVKEYGKTEVEVTNGGGELFRFERGPKFNVWMSHGDEVTRLPPGFTQTARSAACNNVAAENTEKRIWGLQFHPEVVHTDNGFVMLRNFIGVCRDASPWSIDTFQQHMEHDIRAHVGARRVFILVSGGVDSTVAYTFLQKLLGPERVMGLLVDTGFMRKGEVALVQESLRKVGFARLHVEDASALFFERLKGVYEPEHKRRIIGDTFLDVKDQVAARLNLGSQDWLLGQGTIYPDTIETGGTKHAAKIKTHHNRVDAIAKLLQEGKVVEPLRDLYKDEVRSLGRQLGLPAELVMRHPFPGPGLAVRILCTAAEEPFPERAETERAVLDWCRAQPGLADVACCVLPVKSVGVQGDARSYRHAVALFLPDGLFTQPVPDPQRLASAWAVAAALPNRFPAINRVLVCASHTHAPALHFSPQSFLTRERVALLAEADDVVHRAVLRHGLYDAIWQFPVALLPVGVAPSAQSIVLRPVESQEAMTANSYPLPPAALGAMTKELLALPGIDAVFYDLTSKPPGTIEWE